MPVDVDFSQGSEPIWVIAVVLLIVLPLSAYVGWKLGRRIYEERGYATSPPSSYPGEASMGALLALLGFLLAFTFGFALDRAEARKSALLNEAQAIGTAFLRADILAEPGRTELRQAIADYAGTRVLLVDTASKEEEQAFVSKTMDAQAKIWPVMLEAFAAGTPAPVMTNVMNGITDMLDAHTARLFAGVDSVPTVAKIMVLFCAASALFTLGNASALRGRQLTWRTLLFGGVLSVIMIVIVDFERSREGFIRLDQTVMFVTIQEIQASVGSGL